jgi:hypothetical protein
VKDEDAVVSALASLHVAALPGKAARIYADDRLLSAERGARLPMLATR